MSSPARRAVAGRELRAEAAAIASRVLMGVEEGESRNAVVAADNCCR